MGKSMHSARVLVLGVAFKRDIDDARNSPAERIIELLLNRGVQVSYSDPYVPRYRVGRDVFLPGERWLESVDLSDETLSGTDCVLIVAGHQTVDYGRVLQLAPLVVDTVNATRGLGGPATLVRVGAPA
jgi:UDP-N-acetyl-D-glucosamine dehydrogenase